MTQPIRTATQNEAMDWQTVAARLFPEGQAIVQQGDLLIGTGRCGGQTFAVLGTADHAEIGVEVSLAMAQHVLRMVRVHPGRPLLFLMDTQGQRLRRRDELLGINSYMALLAKAVQVARNRGHRVLGLIYDQGLSGGILASAMVADVCGALPGAEIRAMNLPAMARITRIGEERLYELAQSSPVFAPGAINYIRMGAIDSLWEGDLAQCLQAALERADDRDHRSRQGQERGGRLLAHSIARRVANDAYTL